MKKHHVMSSLTIRFARLNRLMKGELEVIPNELEEKWGCDHIETKEESVVGKIVK
jgi:hypothetical protein